MRVVVAMSGGVDSSVVAGLMARAGHEVIGVTLQLYDHGAAVGRKGACCAGQDIHDAKRVADRLGIAHYVIDAEARFRGSVIAAFADSYASGETPVPCIACNQHLKFGDLLGMARDLGAEAMATGHYVRRVEGRTARNCTRRPIRRATRAGSSSPPPASSWNSAAFRSGTWSPRPRCGRSRRRWGWWWRKSPTARTSASCRPAPMPGSSKNSAPRRWRRARSSPRTARVLGQHQGIARYTVGQAKGLGNAAQRAGEPIAVKRIEPGTRRIVVGPRGAAGPRGRLRDVNWLIDPPAGALRATAKLRARDGLHPAAITRDGAGALVTLDEPAIAAPGQAAVFYDGSRILGGGVHRLERDGFTDRSRPREQEGKKLYSSGPCWCQCHGPRVEYVCCAAFSKSGRLSSASLRPCAVR